jgi:predicted DNA-binding transcriptional regulator AlpA
VTASVDSERTPPPGDRFLGWKTVKSLTGFSRTTAWRRQKAGDFPTPRQISPGRVGWLESEVNAWQASRAPRSESELPAFRVAEREEEAKALAASTPQRRGAPNAAPRPQPADPIPRAKPKRGSGDEAQRAFEF